MFLNMILSTSRFGQITVDEEKIITFANGLPGFEQFRKFTLLQMEPDNPFAFLQSVEDGNLAFIVTNPFLFYSDYEFELSDDDVAELEIDHEQEVAIWSIVSIKEELADATLNLLAPVVINQPKKLAKQIILHNSPYQTKHKLMRQDLEHAKEGY